MILKEAWKQACTFCAEGRALYEKSIEMQNNHPLKKSTDACQKLRDESNKLYNKGDELYIKAVREFFDHDAVINWDNGDVDGKILPIPWTELGE